MALPKPQLNGGVLEYDELQTDYANDLESRIGNEMNDLENRIGDEMDAQTITSGSNPNGSWTKFPDGTMINRGTVAMDHAGSNYRSATVQFPINFINTDYHPTAVPNAGGISNFGSILVNSYTTAQMVIDVERRSTAPLEVRWTATGRWK